ncbi:hypothetical protein [Plantactinospora sp. B5E13]|uniref:hypothetical protein n=1 Tax=unclassified Plantactinospora TaxID=2631981 RepID=UPI00325EA2BA
MSPVDPGGTAAAMGAVIGAQMGAAAGVAAAALFQQISVNIDGLAKAAKVMREELQEGYRTQLPPVYEAASTGSTIGLGIPGPDWESLRQNYHVCIEKTCQALDNLDLGTLRLAQAAERIAKSYRDADELSQAKVSDVNNVLVSPEQQQPTSPQPSPSPQPSTGRYV